jgi:hypothetical protein
MRDKNKEKHHLLHWPALSTYILALTLLTAAGGDFVLISFTVRLRFFLQTAAG